MLLIDSPPLPPAESVALDALLLDRAIAGEIGDCLRLWTTERYCVVMGRSGKAEAECHEEACRRDGVEIVQRASGGGTVLLGPGCLNYSIILDTRNDPRLCDVKESYRIILGRIVAGLRAAGVAAAGNQARIECCADLALAGRKFGGTAQLRRRGHLLHHGTLLCGFEINLVERYLKHPPKEPPYRQGRPHGDFITNLTLTPDEAGRIVRKVFGAAW